MIRRCLMIVLIGLFPMAAVAQTAAATGTDRKDLISIGMFLVIVAATLVITFRSAQLEVKGGILHGRARDHAVAERLRNRGRFSVCSRVPRHFRACLHQRI
jgi:hypothetical protein